jgi:large subunit ribosomal protein L23
VKPSHTILIKPLVTEKAAELHETQRKVAFAVSTEANKIEIRQAVEKRFNVKVEKVATSNFEGKTKRLGRHQGRRPDFKKAVVTLKEGFKIELFEGK